VKSIKRFVKLLPLVLVVALVVPLTGGSVAAQPSEDDIQDAIEAGLEYLVSVQNPDGSWNYRRSEDPPGSEYPSVAATGQAVLAFEQQGYLPTGNPEDPYVQAVIKGLDYILSHARIFHLDKGTIYYAHHTPYGDPDSDSDGQFIVFVDDPRMYTQGIAVHAIVNSLAPDRTAMIFDLSILGPVMRTYREIVEDAVDFIAYGQNDYLPGRGGWRYGANYGEIGIHIKDSCNDYTTWTPTDGVTLSDSSEVREPPGTSLMIDIPGAYTTSWAAYKTAVSAQDWTGYTQLRLWVMSSVDTDEGDLSFGYDEESGMTSPEMEWGMPGLNAGEWYEFRWGLGPDPALRDGVVTWGLKVNEASLGDLDVYIDDIGLWPGDLLFESESDNSVSMWPVLGLYAAEATWGVPVPGFAKFELDIWIDYIQNDENGGSGYTAPDEWVNVAKTGGLLVEQAFCGDTIFTERVQHAVKYITKNWETDGEHLMPPNGSSPVTSYYGMYSVMKGLRLLGIETLPDGRNWYNEYAEYLLDHQNLDGSWGPGQWGNEPICTAWAILTLCKKVIPGIDYIEIDHMRVEFDTRPNRDKIKIFQARLQLDEGASYDLTEDDVMVSVDGVVITIPAGSFDQKGNKEKYHFTSTGGVEPKVSMDLDFDKGEWSLMAHDVDASVVCSCDGVHVILKIGYMIAGKNVPMWVDYLVYPPTPSAH